MSSTGGNRAAAPGRAIVLALLLGVVVSVKSGGCASRPDWQDRPQAATLAYWIDEPARVRVESDDYQALWQAAENSIRRFGFTVAMHDYEGGLLTTEPMVSAQWFEPWRQEVRTPAGLAESSLGAVRRRLRFELGTTPDGGWYLEPKVLVERQSLAERRITNAIDYRYVLGPGRQEGSREADRGVRLPPVYWYAAGRDHALEQNLARRIARRSQGQIIDVPAEPPVEDADSARAADPVS